MAELTREQVSAIVLTSLGSIANLPDTNVEAASFAMLNTEQKQVFLSTLKTNLNASPYYDDEGAPSNEAYYDVSLTMSVYSSWTTVGDCIDWVTENQEIFPK